MSRRHFLAATRITFRFYRRADRVNSRRDGGQQFAVYSFHSATADFRNLVTLSFAAQHWRSPMLKGIHLTLLVGPDNRGFREIGIVN